MCRYLLLFFFCHLIVAGTAAQSDYKSAVGLRLGSPVAISFKHKLSDSDAIEFTLSTRGQRQRFSSYRWLGISGGYQVHNGLNLNVSGLEQLQWYFGGGAAAYFWSWDYDSGFSQDQYSSTSFGIVGYLGLEYTFDSIPVNLSLDWTPVFAFNGFGSGFGAGFAGLAVRYVLN